MSRVILLILWWFLNTRKIKAGPLGEMRAEIRAALMVNLSLGLPAVFPASEPTAAGVGRSDGTAGTSAQMIQRRFCETPCLGDPRRGGVPIHRDDQRDTVGEHVDLER